MKKFLVAILFSVFVISLSSCAFAEYYNEGHAGSEADPYAIDSNADMVLLRDRVNAGTEEGGKYYKLTQNLTMSEYTNWDTIGIEKYPFKGHFDGNNLGIQVNMTANRDMSGIFGVISTTEGYAVKNLAVSGHVGGLISGGIIARLNSGNVENCSFNGTVENTYGSPARNGGIVGYLAGGTVKNCSFSGNVNEIHSYNNLAAGGIAGYMTGGSIENCTSNANIQVDSGRDNIWAGGIVGYAQVAGFQAIKDCTFSGTINSKRYSGGIVGYISGGNLQNNHVTSVSNSFSSINGDYVAGGIAGRIGDNVILESCDVVAGTSITAKTEASGGIIGLVNNDSTVRNNISYANVSGDTTNKGGVIGKVDAATSTFSNNKYSSAAHGIGLDDNGVSSERGCIRVGADFTISTSETLTAYVNTQYSVVLELNPVGSATWTLATGSSLPNNLTLNSTTGEISGIPQTEGTYTFVIQATRSTGTATKGFTLTVNKAGSNTLSITTTSLPSGVINTAYTATLTSSPSGASWKYSGNWPTDLTLNASTGAISGTPKTSGTYNFTVQATLNGVTASKSLSITITDN
ncbi:MAG: putative Ig domain-containing protein, partial [Synergistaceae bacterium]|nr:putative Ig domain-containing protein [Synergistaceae bacterium]